MLAKKQRSLALLAWDALKLALNVEWGGLEGAEIDGGGHFEVAAEGVG